MAHFLASFIGVAFAIATLVLLSLGLAIIYGMMGVINLAQGEFIMLGAYTVVFSSAHGLNLWIGMVLAPAVVGLVGLVVERCVIRFLYGRKYGALSIDGAVCR
jgi:branched-chain amino acid transport system permease protein